MIDKVITTIIVCMSVCVYRVVQVFADLSMRHLSRKAGLFSIPCFSEGWGVIHNEECMCTKLESA